MYQRALKRDKEKGKLVPGFDGSTNDAGREGEGGDDGEDQLARD